MDSRTSISAREHSFGLLIAFKRTLGPRNLDCQYLERLLTKLFSRQQVTALSDRGVQRVSLLADIS